MNIELISTSDGSNTLFIPSMNETYHSIHGALTESMHVFIEHGFKKISEKYDDIRVFEVGFGTGLNALLTQEIALQSKKRTEYHSIETFPLSIELMQQYAQTSISGISSDTFLKMHNAPWDKNLEFHDYFKFKKIHGDLLKYAFNETYHLIYFDAFAPEKQEEMWSDEIFSALYNALVQGGVLTTYCVKGIIRRRLKKIGFNIEKLPGPKGGKREMLRATKE